MLMSIETSVSPRLKVSYHPIERSDNISTILPVPPYPFVSHSRLAKCPYCLDTISHPRFPQTSVGTSRGHCGYATPGHLRLFPIHIGSILVIQVSIVIPGFEAVVVDLAVLQRERGSGGPEQASVACVIARFLHKIDVNKVKISDGRSRLPWFGG